MEVLVPEDCIAEIISRLPVKSLLRFRSVCKSWNDLVRDPFFITRHILGASSNHNLLLVSRLDSASRRQVLSFLSYESLENVGRHLLLRHYDMFHQSFGYVQLLGPCNGLFCLSKMNSIAIWNPATREQKVLPPSDIATPEGAQAFDTCIGFGFDAKTNDYKVVAFKHMCFPSSVTFAHVELYSLRTNIWREITVEEEFQPTGNLPDSASSPSINGVFSWFVIDNHVEKVIFSFDMSSEVIFKTQLPDYGIPSKRVHGKLVSLKNSLAFIHDYPYEGTAKWFDVWILGEYGVRESWTKQLTIGPVVGVKETLGFWKSGELLLTDRFGLLMSYDPFSQDMKTLDGCGSNMMLQVFPYKESLVSFKRGHETDGQGQNGDVTCFSITEIDEDADL